MGEENQQSATLRTGQRRQQPVLSVLPIKALVGLLFWLLRLSVCISIAVTDEAIWAFKSNKLLQPHKINILTLTMDRLTV